MPQILIRMGFELFRRDPQISKCLGCRINLLVEELPLNLVRRNRGPPDIVQGFCHGLQDGLRQINVAALRDGVTVDDIGDIAHCELTRAVELEGLAGGAVVVGNGLKAFANIDNLQGISTPAMKTLD